MHLEDAVLVVGVDVTFADALRETDRPREGPVSALEAVEPLLRLLARTLALGGESQRTVGAG